MSLRSDVEPPVSEPGSYLSGVMFYHMNYGLIIPSTATILHRH